MNEKYIETALKKLYNSLLFKERVDFKVKVDSRIFEEGLHYLITTIITVDHAKFWRDSPDFSPEYNDYINTVSDNYSDDLDSFVKYILPTESYGTWLKYEHYNTDVYTPLLNAIGDTGIGYVTEFDEHSPSLMIKLDINTDIENVVSNLKFDTDDIIILYGDIT